MEQPLEPNTIEIRGIEPQKIKSHVKLGNLVIYNTKHFNSFHRIMLKIFFGITIKNLDN